VATIIATEGSLGTTPDTAIESSPNARYTRVSFYNGSTTTARTITVKYGSKVVRKFTLDPLQTRIVGPHALSAAETVKAWQDSGTDVEYRCTGEY